MKTIFKHDISGWKNFKDNQLLRCPKTKRNEGDILLKMPYGYSFLDIGAHFGDTVVTMAMLAKRNKRSDIRFFAFEPNRVKCIHIMNIAKVNNLNITVFCTCIGDINGNAIMDEFTIKTNSNLLGSASFQKDPDGSHKISLLDEYSDKIEPIGFIHIDTEGWETAVLRGASNILANPINKMVVVTECWDNHTALQQINNKRAFGVASETPENEILEEINKYNTTKIGTMFEGEYNIFFRVNF